MQILALTYQNRVPGNARLYAALAEKSDLTHLEVDRDQALDLKQTLSAYDLMTFDRVMVELRAKHVLGQRRQVWKVPNLVLFEEDTWQNYDINSKNYGFFAKYYASVRPARIIHSGFEVAHKTAALGFDSRFLPKGYDGSKLRNTGAERDIELGFVGRLDHPNYVNRKRLLTQLGEVEPLQLLRSSDEAGYLDLLNRIRFFISADVGFGEHMIKNFEAMACGCVLFAYRQGQDDGVLGLEDMHNVVLYRDLAELRTKLHRLRDDPQRADAIARRGQALAEQNHEHQTLGAELFNLLQEPLAFTARAASVRDMRIAEIDMKPGFHAALMRTGTPAGTDTWTYQGLHYRFFPRPGLRHTTPCRRFIHAARDRHARGEHAPVVLCWGRQRESAQDWVAYRVDLEDQA